MGDTLAGRAAFPFVGDGREAPDGPSPYLYAGVLPLPSSAYEAFFSLWSALADRGVDLGLAGRWTMFKTSIALGVGRAKDATTAMGDIESRTRDASIRRLEERMEAAARGEPMSESDRVAMEAMKEQGLPLGPKPDGALAADDLMLAGLNVIG